MFTKHFHNFLIQFWTQCGIGVKDFISLIGYSNTMEGKKDDGPEQKGDV